MLDALAKAFVSLLHPRMLLLMIWPVLVALVLWLVLAIAFWAHVAAAVQAMLERSDLYRWMIDLWPLALIAVHLGWILLALLFVPLVLVTAVAIIGTFAMPMMVNHVSERDYPGLERRSGGTAAGSVWNTLVALVVLAVLLLATLPLWLVPPLWPVLPLLLFGYFNQRVFRYDALAEHAARGEIAAVIRRERAPLLGLGVVVSLVAYVPVLGFFAPVYGGLAFIHYCLARLQELRAGRER